MSDKPISALFGAIVECAIAHGAEHLDRVPGCWEHEVGDEIVIAINGHGEAVKTAEGVVLPAFHAFVQVKGWPAALLSPYDGIVMGGTEGELIEMIKASTPDTGGEIVWADRS